MNRQSKLKKAEKVDNEWQGISICEDITKDANRK